MWFNLIVASSNYSVASLSAFLLGSTVYITSQYLTEFITHSHTAFAAELFFSIFDGSNSSLLKYQLLTIDTIAGFTQFASIISLKSNNLFLNSSGLPIRRRHDFQSTDFGFLFLSTSITSFQNPVNKYVAAANTSGIPGGGFVNDLTIQKSFLFTFSNAFLAYSAIGSAASRSAYVDAYFSETSVFITAHF